MPSPVTPTHTVPPTPAPGSDPIRSLLKAACRANRHIEAGPATRVVVYSGDRKTIDMTVPDSVADGVLRALAAAREPEVPPPSGWSFTDRSAAFDGRAVGVAASRVKLLKALAEARRSFTAQQLTESVFDSETDVANVRYHVKELRRELRAAFPDFEGELVVGEGEGYRLVLR